MWPDFDREELERALDDYLASTGTGAGRDCRGPAARSAGARRIVVAGDSDGVAVPPHACAIALLRRVAIAIAVVFWRFPAFALLFSASEWSRCTSSTGCWRR